MSPPNTKSCIIELVKTIVSVSTKVDAHSDAFDRYVNEERGVHDAIDQTLIRLTSRMDRLIVGGAGFIITLLLGTVGYLFAKVMGWA